MGTLIFILTAVPFTETTAKIPQADGISWVLPAGIVALLFLFYLLLNIDKTENY